MELIRGIHNLHARHHGCVVTIGNFDGVHCGHRAVLDGLRTRGRELGTASCVMIFEPQPLEYFARENAPARLMGFRNKYVCLRELGIERLLVVSFNNTLASCAAEAFIRDVLVDGLGAKHVVVGDDFRFGNQRRGDFAMLEKFGAQHGFSVESTTTYRQDAQRISSTRIREALSDGNLGLASALLGQPYFIEGRVVHGEKRGREIGYPTANVHLLRQHTPLAGVFAAEGVTADGQRHTGMASLGTRPTVDIRNRMSLEIHLFDFNKNLYGQKMRVMFRKFLRPELTFDSVEDMRVAIGGDEREARRFFQNF